MPYITPANKAKLALGHKTENAGELNYQITTLINAYMYHKNKNYQTLNDVVGALEGAKLEFYRRVIIPYETQKIADNGDVYG